MFGSIGNAIGSIGGHALDFVTGGPASALVNLAGNWLSNEANADQAHKQMDFMARMSNTSYQRAVKDLLKAGLNPMLAYSQGGASTPSGAMARMEPVTKDAVENYLRSKQVSSAIALQDAQTAQSATQAQLNTATSAKTQAETLNKIAENPALVKQVEKIEADIKATLASANSSNATAARTQQNIAIGRPVETGATGFMDLFSNASDWFRNAASHIPTPHSIKFDNRMYNSGR